MKIRLIILFILLLAFGYWFAQSANEEKSLINPIVAKIKNVVSGNSEPENKPQESVTAAEAAQNPAIVKELETWIQAEAKKMDTATYDSAREESILRERAQKMSFAEIETLRVVALDANRAANERIFSAYMLTMTSGTAAILALATAPLSNPGEKAPHSLEETQGMHEKALRRMGIDALFTRAQMDPSFIPELAKAIEQISVPELKAYAQERYQQLFD